MLQFASFKYKPMTLEQLHRALERLTRPLHPNIKFFRVLESVFTHNLIEPKLNLKKIKELEQNLKIEIFETIWNSSVKTCCKKLNLPYEEPDFSINNILFEEDKKLFVVEENHPYFQTKLNFSSILKMPCPLDEIPLNLQRLQKLTINCNLETLRYENTLHFPIEKFLIVEGITEEILLPTFAKILDYDFDKFGVHLIAAGGKNPIARWYVQNKNLIKAPIFILLDADGAEIQKILQPQLKTNDKIYLIKNGEFEDIIPKKIIKKTINDTFKNEFNIAIADLREDLPMCKILTELMRIHGVGDFKKADFAKKVFKTLQKTPAVTDELEKIIEQIKNL